MTRSMTAEEKAVAENIISAVLYVFDRPQNEIFSNRKAINVVPRHAMAFMTRNLFSEAISLNTLSHILGQTDHTHVLNGNLRTQERLADYTLAASQALARNIIATLVCVITAQNSQSLPPRYPSRGRLDAIMATAQPGLVLSAMLMIRQRVKADPNIKPIDAAKEFLDSVGIDTKAISVAPTPAIAPAFDAAILNGRLDDAENAFATAYGMNYAALWSATGKQYRAQGLTYLASVTADLPFDFIAGSRLGEGRLSVMIGNDIQSALRRMHLKPVAAEIMNAAIAEYQRLAALRAAGTPQPPLAGVAPDKKIDPETKLTSFPYAQEKLAFLLTPLAKKGIATVGQVRKQLAKDFSATLSDIVKVFDGTRPLVNESKQPTVMARALVKMASTATAPAPSPVPQALPVGFTGTPREFELMRLMGDGPRRPARREDDEDIDEPYPG